MSLSSVVGWWEEWQLRILVLSSLFIQYILCFSLWLRRNPNLRRLRVLVWIAYIGGDAVAIYALATLFNRQKQTWDGASSALEVLWAPVLLVHLGGQPWISAYSLEDNELWKRHTVTLVSQVAVALYVFCKWWSGEKTLLVAAILLFVLGIIRFAQKPCALRTASFNSMQASSPEGRIYLREEYEQAANKRRQREGNIYSLKEYVLEAKKRVLETKVDSQSDYSEKLDFYMFVDQSTPYSVRIKELEQFLRLEYKHAYNTLLGCLDYAFQILYTRAQSSTTCPGGCSILLLPFLALASVVLFAMSHKDGQNEKDIRVTYILLCCTTVLEFLLPWVSLCLSIPCCYSLYSKHFGMGHYMVFQYNLMSFCVRKKKPTCLMKLATFDFLREFVNQHSYIQQVPKAYQITGVVRRHIENGWKMYICDVASYRRFNELRGQWALRRHHQLGWSLKMPYEESVLIWHIATDLCLYHPDTSPQGRQGEATQCSREISNYMIYLLLICPEMLMPGTRSDLFTMASSNIIKNCNGLFDTEEMLVQEILNMPMQPVATNILSDACNLAKALMDLGDEKERWTVIQGVWMEMLCYSASRCRGYLHAKSLGEGGEYLSIVWLLWSFMGMETLADRHQKSEPPQEEEEEV